MQKYARAAAAGGGWKKLTCTHRCMCICMPNCMPDTRQFGYAHENTFLLTHTCTRACIVVHTHIQLQSSNFISFVSLAFLSIISGFFYFRGPTLSKFLVKFFSLP